MKSLFAFDPENPPIEPPPLASQPLLWALSRQVYGDHDVPFDDGRPPLPRCARCDEVWPCRARRLAENGLLAACARRRPGQLDGRGFVGPGG
jgi:hypothetical protein